MNQTSPEIAKTPLKTKYGDCLLYVFSWSNNEQDNVLTIACDTIDIPLVRIQSACYTGEIFGSLDCDCHWQLETSLTDIHENGGLFIYMLKDGRGAGLLTKIRGMALSSSKHIDTADAYRELGVPADPRKYEHAAYILNYFGIERLKLLTNNYRKVEALVGAGFVVERVPLESEPTEYNKSYLRAKAKKLGHMMKNFEK